MSVVVVVQRGVAVVVKQKAKVTLRKCPLMVFLDWLATDSTNWFEEVPSSLKLADVLASLQYLLLLFHVFRFLWYFVVLCIILW